MKKTNNKITFGLLLAMVIFFILPAYMIYSLFGTYDYILNEEADITVGIIFPIIILSIGAIVFKCNITQYDDDNIYNSDTGFVDINKNELNKRDIPKCIIRFYQWIEEKFDQNFKISITIFLIFLFLIGYFLLGIIGGLASVFIFTWVIICEKTKSKNKICFIKELL